MYLQYSISNIGSRQRVQFAVCSRSSICPPTIGDFKRPRYGETCQYEQGKNSPFPFRIRKQKTCTARHHHLIMGRTNHPLVSSPLRTVLLGGSFVLAVTWNVVFGMRAEIRRLDYTSPVDLKWKHQHFSLWHHVDCADWNDNYEGSQQPVRCNIFWFARPGMVICLVGYLIGIGAGFAWFRWCCCLKNYGLINSFHWPKCIEGSKDSSVRQRKIGAIVFFGGFLLFVGWIAVLADSSLVDDLVLSANTTLPDGSPGEEKIHPSRWWYGMLCGPFFCLFGTLIWFYRGVSKGAGGDIETPSVAQEHPVEPREA